MKKILHIDLDGVTFDFAAGFHLLCPDLPLGDGPDYEERSKRVNEICIQNETIFHDLPPIKGAIEAVKSLMDLYDVYFLSTPMETIPLSYSGKKICLDKHFGELAHKKLILTHRKDFVIGDYLIDDTHRNGADKFLGEHIHFGSEKFPDWNSVCKYLTLNY